MLSSVAEGRLQVRPVKQFSEEMLHPRAPQAAITRGLQIRGQPGSQGQPGTRLSRRPRSSEPTYAGSRKVLEGPAELRTPATENAHARPCSQSPGATWTLSASGPPDAIPPTQHAQRLTGRGYHSVHFRRHRHIAEADIRGLDFSMQAERAGGGTRK